MRKHLPSDADLRSILTPFGLRAAIVFGSVARGNATADSDLDLAVLGVNALSSKEKMAMIEALALAFDRPVDLVDLQRAGEPLLGCILAEGRQIMGERAHWAELLSRHLVNQADFVPLQDRILSARRAAWLGQ